MRSVALETCLEGPLAIALRSDDRAAAQWLIEFLHPWFPRTERAGEIEISVSSAATAYAEIAGTWPSAALRRPCFALDQEVVSLPAWSAGGDLAVADLRRSCFLVVAAREIALFGDPSTRRWRFTLQLVIQEVAAARLRRANLDLHAAAVEANGRAVAIVGPKRAGKTTLSFHLLRSGRCRWIANDRAFVGQDPSGTFTIRGVPTAVRIQPTMLAEFPELRRGIRDVERPYLHTVQEVTGAAPSEEPEGSFEFALSPAQIVRQLNVQPLDSAPLGALVFPEVRADTSGFTVERLDPAEVRAAVWANLYGRSSARHEATLFEEMAGGMSFPPIGRADELAARVPGYRLRLGRGAYESPDFAASLLRVVLP